MDSNADRKDDQEACCSDSSYCSPDLGTSAKTAGCCASSTESGKSSSRGSRLRLTAFVVVMAFAIAVAAWTLIRANNTDEDLRAQTRSADGFHHADPGPSMASAEYTVDGLAPGKDLAFLLLAGAEPEEAADAAQAIEQASVTLAARGVKAAAITVSPDDPDYKRAADALGVAKFPAVVLLGRDCDPCVVTGDITGDGLLRTFVQTCAQGCGPGGCGTGAAKSGCCAGN